MGIDSGDDIIPIPGTKRVKYLEQNIEAAAVTFTETEKNQIEEIIKNIRIPDHVILKVL